MGTRVVRIACGPSPLLLPLMFLLLLSPKAGSVLKSGVPSPSKFSGVTPWRLGPQQGWEPLTSGHQDSMSGAEGSFESQWAGDGWRPWRSRKAPEVVYPFCQGGLGSLPILTLSSLGPGVVLWDQGGVQGWPSGSGRKHGITKSGGKGNKAPWDFRCWFLGEDNLVKIWAQ